jgi:hypothetical protein
VFHSLGEVSSDNGRTSVGQVSRSASSTLKSST